MVFIGVLNLTQTPILWEVELKDFDISTLNAVLKRNLPLTFTKGKLDLYAEAKNDKKIVKIDTYIINHINANIRGAIAILRSNGVGRRLSSISAGISMVSSMHKSLKKSKS